MPVTKGKIYRKCFPAFNLIIYFCLFTTALQMQPQRHTARALIIQQSPRNETVIDPTESDYGLLMTWLETEEGKKKGRKGYLNFVIKKLASGHFFLSECSFKLSIIL
jgi:hypothetical protein